MTEKRIGLELKTLNNLIKRRLDKSPVKTDLDALTGTHGYIVGYLCRNHDKGDFFQRDIERQFSLRPSTASVLLQRMEKNGLIVREPLPQDARCKRLVLTDKAWEFHRLAVADHEALERRLRGGITDEELEVFFTVMQKFKANLEEHKCENTEEKR